MFSEVCDSRPEVAALFADEYLNIGDLPGILARDLETIGAECPEFT